MLNIQNTIIFIVRTDINLIYLSFHICICKSGAIHRESIFPFSDANLLTNNVLYPINIRMWVQSGVLLNKFEIDPEP